MPKFIGGYDGKYFLVCVPSANDAQCRLEALLNVEAHDLDYFQELGEIEDGAAIEVFPELNS